MGPALNVQFEPYYAALGLDSSAAAVAGITLQTLNKTFRKLALKCHPDKGGSVEEFRVIQEAYDILLAKFEAEEAENNFIDIVYYIYRS
jgi:curved DNA-binding protein CbpA